MFLCPFCAYINGLSEKPKLQSYSHDTNNPNWVQSIPHGLKCLENSGAKIIDNFLVPRDHSDLFYITKLVFNWNKKHYFIGDLICDPCLLRLYSNNDCSGVETLSEHEKLFRLFMRERNYERTKL